MNIMAKKIFNMGRVMASALATASVMYGTDSSARIVKNMPDGLKISCPKQINGCSWTLNIQTKPIDGSPKPHVKVEALPLNYKGPKVGYGFLCEKRNSFSIYLARLDGNVPIK
jgi:hypothetical protein